MTYRVPRNFSSALVFSEEGITELGDLGTAVGRPQRTKGCEKIELTFFPSSPSAWLLELSHLLA